MASPPPLTSLENSEETVSKSTSLETQSGNPVVSLILSPKPSTASPPLPVVDAVSSDIDREQVKQIKIESVYNEGDIDSDSSDEEDDDGDDDVDEEDEEFEIRKEDERQEMEMMTEPGTLKPLFTMFYMLSLSSS